MSDIFDFLRVPITLIVGSLLTSLIYKYFIDKKKEKQKIVSIKKEMEGPEWKSPLFGNGGIYLGSFFLLLALIISIYSAPGEFPAWGILLTYGFGFMFMLVPHSIRLTRDFIEIQPLLLDAIHLPFFKRIIVYRDITDIKKKHPEMYSDFFIWLEIKTSQGKIKINTVYYNTEIPNALYDVLKTRAGA